MKKRKFFSGFTIVELLAVIAILAIMLGVTLVNLSNNSATNKVQAAQREVASAIKMAQSYALQGKTTGSPAVVPKCWGFKFTTNDTYVIFPSTDCSTGSASETYKLSNGVQLTNPASGNTTRITFSVPNAAVALPVASPLILTLHLNGGNDKTVSITSGGVVTEN